MREQRRRRRTSMAAMVAAALSLACAGLASGHGSHSPKPVDANLDADPALERVVARDLCQAGDGSIVAKPTCSPNETQRHRIEIEDACGGRPARDPALRRGRLRASAQRHRRRRRSGSQRDLPRRPQRGDGRGGAAGVVRLTGAGPDGCAAPRWLLRYPAKATAGALPRRSRELARAGGSTSRTTRRASAARRCALARRTSTATTPTAARASGASAISASTAPRTAMSGSPRA